MNKLGITLTNLAKIREWGFLWAFPFKTGLNPFSSLDLF